MPKRTTRIVLALAALLTATTAVAGPTVEELDQRMRAMEGTMQSILELLQAQQTAGGAPTSAPAAAAADAPTTAPAGYQMGALYLDVYTKTFQKSEYSAMRNDPSALPNGPQGVPVGSVLIKPPANFGYGAFLKEQELASYRTVAANLSVQWSGVLLIQKAGEYNFSVQLKKTGNAGAYTCRSVLRISDKIVADAKGNYHGNLWHDQVDVAQSTQALTEGVYEFSLWNTCLRDNDDDVFDRISTSIMVAAPGYRAPKPISPEQFGVQP